MFNKILLLALVTYVGMASAKPLSELKWDNGTKLDIDNINCEHSARYFDECGLQQGYSHRFSEFAYPTNFTFLQTSCKRQADALKCLRGYSKCLTSLSKQVLNTMINSRIKYNKKICAEKQSEAATKFLAMSQCMSSNKAIVEKALKAELNSVVVPEAIVDSKIDSLNELRKYSCCSVNKVKNEFMEAAAAPCKQYAPVAADVIDSYLSDTVSLICHDFDNKICDKLPKLNMPKAPTARFFIRPIVGVIQAIQAKTME